MKLTVKVIGHLIYDAGFSEKEIEIPHPVAASELLAMIHIPPEKPKIITRNGKAISSNETLGDGDRIVISPIYSGG